MTERLYYDDCYLKEFDAVVISCEEKDGKYHVYLDRSAFYPTSGGQPFDEGTLGDAKIIDVFVDGNNDVCHVIDKPIASGETVHGSIDWTRRFDHMQQHAGEHMIANAVYRLFNGMTIGLHLGSDMSTIDVTMPDGSVHLTDKEIALIEDDVNTKIWDNVPIKQWFTDPEELETLPLRKAPTVKEHVRIVQIGDLEYCACGGTHPHSAGEIGLVKIIEAKPARGKLRLGFVCGKRAYEHLRKEHNALVETANMLSTSFEKVPTSVYSLQNQIKELTLSNAQLEKQLLEASLDKMTLNASASVSGEKIVAEIISGNIAAAREAANTLTAKGYVVIFGINSNEKVNYIVAVPAGSAIKANALLSDAAKLTGGKGGGKADFAQGSGSPDMLSEMLRIAKEQ